MSTTTPTPQLRAVAATPDLESREFFINRELSLLEFNRRVLAQAEDERVPLLERLRFVSILSSNLDEFFEVRVSGLKQEVLVDLARPVPDGLSPRDTLRVVAGRARDIIEAQYKVLNEVLLPELEREGIRLPRRGEWGPALQAWVAEWFGEQALPVLTPVGLDPAHPFPNVQNKGLNFIVQLKGTDAFGRDSGLAVVQVPRCLPRVIRVPDAVAEFPNEFVLLSSVIHAHMDQLFPGMKIKAAHQFRVTRNSDLWVEEEEVEDLLSALKGELPARQYGHAVRLEVARLTPESVVAFLREQFDLIDDDVFVVDGPVNLHRVGSLAGLVERPDLKYPPFLPGIPEGLDPKADIFALMRNRDILLHHPYQSFQPVVELLRTAANDPDVLAIKQTLYRTDSESPVVDSLIAATRAGKAITVVVELRARFDEAANISAATRLQNAGASVVYGVVGHKCHSKMLMIVRRENNKLRRYVHLGTGNYHSGTARFYTDFGLLSANKKLGADVHALFLQLTGLGRVAELRKMLQAPFTLLPKLLELIAAEATEAAAGRPAYIRAKMNSLTEVRVVRALYEASQAGVQIDLVVRGVCRLRPGVPGVSENIRVRSIVGRFLEHSRVYTFHAAGAEAVFCSSADWMGRNLLRRVETCFPVEDEELKQRVIREAITLGLSDNEQAWELQTDGTYQRAKGGGNSLQLTLLADLADKS